MGYFLRCEWKEPLLKGLWVVLISSLAKRLPEPWWLIGWRRSVSCCCLDLLTSCKMSAIFVVLLFSFSPKSCDGWGFSFLLTTIGGMLNYLGVSSCVLIKRLSLRVIIPVLFNCCFVLLDDDDGTSPRWEWENEGSVVVGSLISSLSLVLGWIRGSSLLRTSASWHVLFITFSFVKGLRERWP